MYKQIISGLMVCLFLCSSSCYAPKYSYRVLFWQDSDYDDYKKFKHVTIQASDVPFNFKPSHEDKIQSELSRLSSMVKQETFDQFLEERGTYSFVVIRNDSILLEKYFGQNQRETLQNTFSVSKSILGLAVSKALELGFIESLEESITTYIPELKERDQNFDKISIKHLLTMRSGIKYVHEVKFPWLNCDNPLTYYHPNLRKVALNKTRIDHAPGEKFIYNNYNPLLLGLIMERATNRKLHKFIEQYIWSKIGATDDAIWSTDERGFEKMESGFMATPIDLAKVGRMILNKGKHKENSIISESVLNEFTKTVSTMKVFEDREWGYSHLWWTLPDQTVNPSIMANGHMGQFIFINPKTNYIIIRNGLKVGKFYDDDWTEIFKEYTKD